MKRVEKLEGSAVRVDNSAIIEKYVLSYKEIIQKQIDKINCRLEEIGVDDRIQIFGDVK